MAIWFAVACSGVTHEQEPDQNKYCWLLSVEVAGVVNIIEFFRGRFRRGDNFMPLVEVFQTLYSKRQKHPFLP